MRARDIVSFSCYSVVLAAFASSFLLYELKRSSEASETGPRIVKLEPSSLPLGVLEEVEIVASGTEFSPHTQVVSVGGELLVGKIDFLSRERLRVELAAGENAVESHGEKDALEARLRITTPLRKGGEEELETIVRLACRYHPVDLAITNFDPDDVVEVVRPFVMVGYEPKGHAPFRLRAENQHTGEMLEQGTWREREQIGVPVAPGENHILLTLTDATGRTTERTIAVFSEVLRPNQALITLQSGPYPYSGDPVQWTSFSYDPPNQEDCGDRCSLLPGGILANSLVPPPNGEGDPCENASIGLGVRPQDGEFQTRRLVDIYAERAGGGRPLSMERSYRSADLATGGLDGILGRGWDFNWAAQFKLDNYSSPTKGKYSLGRYRRDTYDGAVQDGSDYVFSDLPTGYGDTETAVQIQNSIIRQEKINGYVQEFDQVTGLLKSRTDRYGNAATVSYDQNGKISYITDNVGRSLTFSYYPSNDGTAPGRLSKIQGPNFQEMTYQYTYTSGDVFLTKVTRGSQTRMVEGTWQTTSHAWSETYAYNTDGRLTQITDSQGTTALTNYFDSSSDQITKQSIFGQDHYYDYGSDQPCVGCKTYSTASHYRPFDSQENNEWTTGLTAYVDPATNLVEKSRLLYKGPTDPPDILESLFHTERDITYTECSCGCMPTVISPEGRTTTTDRSSTGNPTEHTEHVDLWNPLTGLPLDVDPDHTDDIIYGGEYDSNGLLTKHIDPLGAQTLIQYDQNFNPTRITHPATNGGSQTHIEDRGYNSSGQLVSRYLYGTDIGVEQTYYSSGAGKGKVSSVKVRKGAGANDFLTWSYGYNSAGAVTSVTGPNGRTTTYTVDGDNLVTKVVYPHSSASSRITKTNYYNKNLLLAEVRLDNRVEGVLQSNAYWTRRITHTASNLVSKVEWEVSQSGSTPVFQSVTYAYDAGLRLTRVTDPDGRTVDYAYDERNLVTVVTLAAGTAAEEVVAEYQYDGDGLLTQVTRSFTNPGAGSATEVVSLAEYDSFGRLTKTLDSDSQANYTSFSYDKLHRIVKVETFDAADNSLARYQRAYDALGRLTKTINGTDGDGQTDAEHFFEYDQASRLTAVIDHDGNETNYEYDIAGRLTLLVYPSVSGTGTYNTIQYFYDSGTQLTKVERIDANTYDSQTTRTHTWSYTYDSNLGFLRSSKFWGTDGEDSGDPTWTAVQYDSRGLPVRTEDENGVDALFKYDGAGKLTETTLDYGGSGATTTTIAYDGAGHITAQTDALSRTTNYYYDTRSRLTKTALPGGDWTTYGYNEIGALKALDDSKGAAVDYRYDDRGRLTQKDVSFGSGSLQTTEENFYYDGAHRLTKATDDDTEVRFGFNGSGQLEWEKLKVLSLSEQTTDYDWDPDGRLESVTYPVSGRSFDYAYDGLSRVTSIEDSSANEIVHYWYEGPGSRLVRKERSSDLASDPKIVTTFDWDVYNRNTRIHHQYDGGGTPSTIRDLTYGWGDDQAGKFFERASYDVSTGASTTTHDFEYDSLYRLTSATENSYTWDYNYNAAQSRSSVDGPSKDYSYSLNSENQITYAYIQDAYGTATKTYSYDAAGSLTSRTDYATGKGKTLTYNYRNQLVKVVDTDAGYTSLSYEFLYDVLGRRVYEKRTANGSSDEHVFFYAGSDLVVETDETLSVERETLFGLGVDRIEWTKTSGGGDRYPLQDALGSVIAVTDGQGAIKTSFTYSVYGETGQSGEAMPYAYNGRRHLSDTKLYDYRNRWYDPEDGRFVQRDPIGIWGDGVGLGNGYAYVGNNPANRIDPFGLEEIEVDGLSGAGIYTGQPQPKYDPETTGRTVVKKPEEETEPEDTSEKETCAEEDIWALWTGPRTVLYHGPHLPLSVDGQHPPSLGPPDEHWDWASRRTYVESLGEAETPYPVLSYGHYQLYRTGQGAYTVLGWLKWVTEWVPWIGEGISAADAVQEASEGNWFAAGAAGVGAIPVFGKFKKIDEGAELLQEGLKRVDDLAETGIQKVGGRNPINSRFAGDSHPSGVRFKESGFPDFSPHAKAEVELDGLTGKYDVDAALANRAAGLSATPPGHVWHHVEDGRTMQLLPRDIHGDVRHTGGAARIRHGE